MARQSHITRWLGKEEDSEELPSGFGIEPIDHRQECRRVEDCCQGASAFDSASEIRSRRWLLAAIADQKCALARLVRSRQLIRNHPTLPPDLHDFFACGLPCQFVRGKAKEPTGCSC